MKVRKAVIPAAGYGTRMLPASKVVPKEMIPVVDRPGIQYVVEEAVRAGIEDVLFVTSAGKVQMEDHFDRAWDLEAHLEQKGKADELEDIRGIASLAQMHSVRQHEALGLGHAVAMARSHVGDEPFAVLYPDEILPEPGAGDQNLLSRMVEVYEETGSSVIMVQEVPLEDVSAYGCIEPEFVNEDIARVLSVVEKPNPEDAPSNLASRGRHILGPEIFDAIDRTEPGVGNEIQLADAIGLLAREQTVYAVVHRAPVYDVGKKIDYLKATVELALARDDLAKPFLEYLRDVVDRES